MLNALLLAIAVATLVLLLQFAQQAGERFERDARGIDLVVGAKGSPLQLVLSSVYHIDVPTGNIPLGELDRLRADPGAAEAVPPALGDNFQAFRIVGSDEPGSYKNLRAHETGPDFGCRLLLVKKKPPRAAATSALRLRWQSV
ncbi:MAG: hypothetical protein IBJ05_08655, partial [Blastomonas sp.]|nr:hypothetical protein [Blastomonas sp.]